MFYNLSNREVSNFDSTFNRFIIHIFVVLLFHKKCVKIISLLKQYALRDFIHLKTRTCSFKGLFYKNKYRYMFWANINQSFPLSLKMPISI